MFGQAEATGSLLEFASQPRFPNVYIERPVDASLDAHVMHKLHVQDTTTRFRSAV